MRLIIALVTALFAAPAMAQQTEPSARRITILCQLEDPQCAPLLVGLARDVARNPTLNGARLRCPTEDQLTAQEMQRVAINFFMYAPSGMSPRMTMIYELQCRPA
jgi:hypothetical protein